jgi:hypothetical protein
MPEPGGEYKAKLATDAESPEDTHLEALRAVALPRSRRFCYKARRLTDLSPT